MEEIHNYREYYRQLPEILVLKYPELNFQNHCYLRIALDNVIGTKWDTRIPRPAYKNLTAAQRGQVIDNLSHYLNDRNMLESHHLISLAYRGKLI